MTELIYVDVEVEGLTLTLEVEGEFTRYEPTTEWSPGEDDGFEANSIKVNGTELINSLPSDIIDRIALMAMEDLLDEED